jgi:hypothetical protein
MIQMLTTADLEKMTTDDRWLGFGYLGERRNELDPEGRHTAERAAELVAKADAMALTQANLYGLTYEEVFTWANSKRGRWYGDCWFGANGQHAERYLPTEFGHRHGR